MKKLIALLLSVTMCIALLPVINAGTSTDAKMTPAEREARIEELLAYTSRLKTMIDEYGPADAKKHADDLYATARIMVKSSEELDYTGAIAYVNGYDDLHVIQYATPEEAEAAVKRYENLSYVEYANPDTIAQICATPGDYEYVSWGYGENYVNAASYNSWLLNQFGSVEAMPEIIVAVVDTGADSDHPMIADRLVPGYDFENSDADPEDDHGHGTHVSGTIIDGTFENVKVMPIKVLDAEGYGDEAIIAAGMEYAVLNGCSAANMSLSGPCTEGKHSRYLEVAELAIQNNCAFCVAAGNTYGGSADIRCPANVEGCITVASYAQGYILSDFSSIGNCVDITAPGTGIRSARMGGGYVAMDGTSMATPHVAAACAMLKTYDPDMSVDTMLSIIQSNAVGPQFVGGGVGCLNVANMLSFYGLAEEGTNIRFSSECSYPWSMNEAGYAQSGNAGINSTTSTLTGIVNTKPYQIISFEYKVSSQSGDNFVFSVDGVEKLNTSGNQNWQTFSCTIPGMGSTELTWDFVKDASGASGDDRAYIRNVSISDSISTVLNTDGNCYEFISEGNYAWVIDGDAVKSGNAGANNTVSTMTTSMALSEGMVIAIDYKVDAASGDIFTFKINGNSVISTSNTNGYAHFEYQATTSGNYSLEFAFTKDASNSSGSDCAWVKNFFVGHTLNSALNVPGGNLNFSSPSQTFPWQVDGSYAVSGNAGNASTTSYFELSIDLAAGDTISFDYKVSSETNYDKFYFYVNGSALVTESGVVSWTTYTYTATSNGSYTFKWAYTKDGSIDRNDDAAYVDNVEVISSIGTPGDIDGDGNVSVQDATITMRYALGLIDGTGLNIDVADMNGDGEITVEDATLVMRLALGL